MKKSAIIFSIMSVVLFSAGAFAEDQTKKDMGMMGGKMHEPPKMVATSDGGVIVLAGRKLSKYDGLLNLVKEVEMQGGPSPKALPPDSEFKPMDEGEIAAMLEQETPAPEAVEEVPAVQEPAVEL